MEPSSGNAPMTQWYIGAKAVKVIGKIRIADDDLSAMQVAQWKEDEGVSAFVLKIGDRTATFALLSKPDFDPMNQFSNPYTLNFIYTSPEYRRKGYAMTLLNHIKNEKRVEFTAFCLNSRSQSVFKKSGCQDFGEYNHNRMFRSAPRT